MASVCLYFKVHQPYRLKEYRVKGLHAPSSYEDFAADRQSMDHLADNCYLPANNIIKHLITEHAGNFRVSFSISGTALELFRQHRPDVIDSFQELVKTGYVELLGETYYHSLSFLHSKKEFRRQVKKHADTIKEVFDIAPQVFRNTELIYNNQLAKEVADIGFNGILCEGVQKILRGRSANKLFRVAGDEPVKLFLRDASLSDDIAFRFDDANWDKYPLTAGRFAEWLHLHSA